MIINSMYANLSVEILPDVAALQGLFSALHAVDRAQSSITSITPLCTNLEVTAMCKSGITICDELELVVITLMLHTHQYERVDGGQVLSRGT